MIHRQRRDLGLGSRLWDLGDLGLGWCKMEECLKSQVRMGIQGIRERIQGLGMGWWPALGIRGFQVERFLG